MCDTAAEVLPCGYDRLFLCCLSVLDGIMLCIVFSTLLSKDVLDCCYCLPISPDMVQVPHLS